MVSTGMQGGCVCENCSYLRVNTGNVEIAGMFAPKPLAMSAANDWTKELMTKGYPELKALYKLYGAEDKVSAKAWLEYGHQYNQHAREFMYTWFVKHLKEKDEVVKEPPYKPTPVKELSVFDAEHPRPKDELNAEKLREAMAKASDEQMAKLFPKDAASLKEFRRVVGTALRAMVSSEIPKTGRMNMWGPKDSNFELPGGIKAAKFTFSWVPPDAPERPKELPEDNGERIPLVTAPLVRNNDPGRPYAIWLHPKGKSSVVENGRWNPAAKKLLDSGWGLCAIDLLGTGEQVGDKPFPVDKNYAGFTYGYNRTLLANRVRDVLSAVAQAPFMAARSVHLVGWGEMGPVAILAKAIAGDKVAKTAADMNQFRFETVKDTADPMMLPGAVKYGGLPAFLALCAPGEVLAHNHAGTASGRLSRAAYEAAGAADKLTRVNEKMDDLKVVEWLLK
jgi:hypothetical protein